VRVLPVLSLLVIPAKAGIHLSTGLCLEMDPGFRRDDDEKVADGGALRLDEGIRK